MNKRENGISVSVACAEQITDIDHVAIAVEDLEEAVDWYVSKLGFVEIERRVTSGESTGMISALLRCGRAIVVLVQGTTPDSQVSRFIDKLGPGVQHLAFSVVDIGEALSKTIAAGGAADTPIVEGEGIRQVFLRRDFGSGVRVELVEKRGGTFSDSTVERIFRTLEEKGLY